MVKKIFLLILFPWICEAVIFPQAGSPPCSVGGIILQLAPGSVFSLDSDDYSTLIWFSPVKPPSALDVQAALPICHANQVKLDAEKAELQNLTSSLSGKTTGYVLQDQTKQVQINANLARILELKNLTGE